MSCFHLRLVFINCSTKYQLPVSNDIFIKRGVVKLNMRCASFVYFLGCASTTLWHYRLLKDSHPLNRFTSTAMSDYLFCFFCTLDRVQSTDYLTPQVYSSLTLYGTHTPKPGFRHDSGLCYPHILVHVL